MDAYLAIAQQVLRAARQPMSPRRILDAAFRASIVPHHLHGKTQHKTLQARISEDILLRRGKSLFFRTQPGRFFLREFQRDLSISEKYRHEFASRRRQRELLKGPALAIDKRDLAHPNGRNNTVDAERVITILTDQRYNYDDPKNANPNSVFIWSFVAVMRDNSVLSYRLGRYRDDRDNFVHKRTIGISSIVYERDRDLFNLDNYGILQSGYAATAIDLDIPILEDPIHFFGDLSALCCFLWPYGTRRSSSIAALIRYECPEWYEPTRRHLAMRDLQWLDLDVVPNNLDDFDPWSRIAITERQKLLSGGLYHKNAGTSRKTVR